MKKVLIVILASFSLFADTSSIERPNLTGKIDQTAEYLESIDYKIEEIINALNSLSSIPLEQRQSSFYLNEMQQHLALLLTTLERTNDLLDHLIWLQDHRLGDRVLKKNPNGRGSGG